jgi:hypothetical protein
MYKILFDMRNDINDLKSLTSELIKNRGTADLSSHEKNLINRIYTPENQQNVAPNSYCILKIRIITSTFRIQPLFQVR